ncbi:MAG: protoheme IX farnesyltransferase [Candidatus Marinimicrobia bacterium]|nr:protoheme IX farnesyltransferase [Candidatus Neomarinimicrobiota bacterium]|tara:strand:- start:23572 stop:24447 length:876 start_codon:yes stop_codon:yes gene_type:complete
MIRSVFAMMKFRISLLVIITSYLGYYLGLRYIGLIMIEQESIITFLNLAVGVFLTSSSSAIFNQYLEIDLDAKMSRTMFRPLPSKKINKNTALMLAIFLALLGLVYIYMYINTITTIIAFSTIFSYVFIYTPSKTKSKWNTIIGSFPGALPPVGGWTAATGEIQIPAVILFLILFCWQIPHFLSLAIIYKDDYKQAGFKMLPSVSKNLDSTLFQIIFFTVALIVSSIGIYLLNLTSFVYMLGAVLLGVIFLLYSSSILFEDSNEKVRKLFVFSIIYLPLLMILIILDTLLV